MMVVSIVAIIGILAFTLLTVSLITYRMKNTNMNSKKNFYSAEQVLDDISVGLQQDISEASGEAYVWTLEHFSDNNASEEDRRRNYVNKFKEILESKIIDTTPGVSNTYVLHYSLNHLSGMVSPEAKAEAQTCTVKAVGDLNVINQDLDMGTYTIKNLDVTYVDGRNYMTNIQTDIVLSCPRMDFDQASTAPLDLTAYTLIANEKTETSGTNISVKGSAYLGNQGATLNAASGVTFETPTDGTTGRIITGNNLVVKQGGNLTVKTGYQTWARSLVVDAAQADISGLTYLNNDVVVSNSIGTSTSLKMSGQLYAYGRTATSDVAEVYDVNTKKFEAATSLLADHPADFSSAVLINGKNATVDFQGLTEMTISGNAYVGTSLNDSTNSDVEMGESISLKSDQRAYLVPAKYIAPYCENGQTNPMTEEKFEALQKDIMDAYGYTDANQIKNYDYIRADKDAVDGIPEDLAKEGVVGIRKAWFRFSASMQNPPKNMVYFFLVFDNTNSANAYALKYWNEHPASIQGRIYPDDGAGGYDYDNGIVSITYPDANLLPSDYNFYYNGCVLVPNGVNTKFYAGKLSSLSDQYPTLQDEERSDQQTYAALRHKLSVDWSSMTSEEYGKTVYENLVVPDMANMTDTTKNIVAGHDKRFYQDGDDTTRMSAVVVNDNYTVPDSGALSKDGKSYPIHVIIAKGNVTIPASCNYTGLIIAGGEVTVAADAKLTADRVLAQQALCIKDGDTCAADYLINGSAYTAGSNGGDTDTGDTIDFSTCVTYENWTKQ